MEMNMSMRLSRVARAALVAATLGLGIAGAAPAMAAGQWHGGWGPGPGHGWGPGWGPGWHGGWGPGWGWGFGVGVLATSPYWWGYGPYPYGYYYPPVAIGVPSEAPTYVERGQMGDPNPSGSGYYWYYCANSNGYYPYVKECPGGWQKVTPTPPNPQ